ncbi:FMRFamide receptor-like [Ruditapes philippinarum]|uniref:FMRFamide receptor-like n=1 Tax=Ruditapes philippinarum TaxID=129788 RepID=UPI00295A9EAC|nr:FMRFamide receptor-like [Ruditapes philippinarum]
MENTSNTDAGNFSKDAHIRKAENMIASVEMFAVPVICLLGLTGNTFSIVVFTRKCLRSKSCSVFLAARSFSDNGFLITLLVMWISSVFGLQLSRIDGVCRVIVFLTYVFGCLSVWLMVFVTIENYIRVCKPFMVNKLCNTSTAKYAVILLFVIVICCYNFPLWTMAEQCAPHPNHHNILKIMQYVDSLFTLFVPIAVMSFLVFRIVVSSVVLYERRRRLSSVSSQISNDLTMKVKTMLLAVILIFIILNLPLHVVRIRLIVISFIKDQIDITTPIDVIVQSIAQLIYYLSLTVNFIVYYLFGGLFRRTFIGLLCGRGKNPPAQANYSAFIALRTRNIRNCYKPALNDRLGNNSLSNTSSKDFPEKESSDKSAAT